MIHLFRRVRGVDANEPVQAFGAEAFALLERTFAHGGGVKAALLEARTGAKGGMRYVLDAMTEQFKKEERGKEVERVSAGSSGPPGLGVPGHPDRSPAEAPGDPFAG